MRRQKYDFLGLAEILYLCSVLLLTNMKKRLLKIYWWYSYFCSNGPDTYWDAFFGMGFTLFSIVILFCYPCVYILEPSREVFYNLYLARVLLIAFIVLVVIFPILSSIVMRIHLPYDKFIRTEEFRIIEKQMLNIWNKRSFFWFLLIRLMTYILPGLLFIFLMAFFELVVNV